MLISCLKCIETERLRIRPVELSDVWRINTSVRSTAPQLQTWLAWAQDTSLDATQSFVESGMDAWLHASGTYVRPMTILHKDTGEFIGCSGFTDQSDPADGVFDIGYWCDSHHQGQGYITECVTALCHFAFHHADAVQVVIRMATGNEKSIAVPKRLGFTCLRTQPSVSLPGAEDYVYVCDRDHAPKPKVCVVHTHPAMFSEGTTAQAAHPGG